MIRIPLIIISICIYSVVVCYSQCNNRHFYAPSCNAEWVLSTTTPLLDECYRWPAPATGNNPHIAMYQNQIAINPPSGPNETINFNINEAIAHFNWARSAWSNQCNGPRGLTWETTTSGGRIFWSSDQMQIPASVNAMYQAAVDPDNISILVAQSDCTPAGNNLASIIILSDTPEIYVQVPPKRWTTSTDYGDCGRYYCLDFQTIILHELGHYVGLDHDGSSTSVMASGERGRQVDLEMCDVDRFRRLYCTASVGDPVVSIKQEAEPGEVKLEVSPHPFSDHFVIGFETSKRERVRIYLSDLLGNSSLILDEIFSKGRHEYTYPTFNYASGNYILRMELDDKVITQNVILVK